MRIQSLVLGVLLGLGLTIGAAAQTAPPVLDPISPQGPVNEGDSLGFAVTVTDADLTIPVLSTSSLPANASFIDNLDGTGSFSFEPDFTQAGVVNVMFYATDAVTADVDSELVSITVNNVNQLPVLATISPQGPVDEGDSLGFAINASDADTDIPVLTTSALPPNASFTDNLDGTGTFSFEPDFTQSGVVNITFYATDALVPADVDSEVVSITVNNVNQLPVLATISPQGPVDEGDSLGFAINASDPDTDIPVLTTSALPANASFTDNLDGTGSFSFEPDFTQSGVVNITFYATDALVPADVDSEVVSITVNNVNQLPVLATISPQGPVDEGDSLGFAINASDPDTDIPVLTTSALPANASFTDNLDGTGSFSFEPDFTQSGVVNITFYATDALVPADVDSEVVSITVNNANQLPVLATISPQGPVAEGATLNFNISATDGDGDIPVLTTSSLPANASFNDNLDGTGSFSFSPDFTQSGVVNITFYATDGAVPADVDSEVVSITINNVNQLPILATISPQGPVDEGATLNFGVTASDADGVFPVLTTSALPANASFTDNLDGTGSFSFSPDFTQSGVVNIWFYATDGAVPADVDSELVSITVNDINQAPVLATISPQGPVAEGANLSFNVSATDGDGDTPVLTTSALPANASFVDNLDGTGSFSFDPDFTQSGVHNIWFYATDGVVPSSIDSELVAITVTDAGNQAPVLATISPQGPVVEGANLSFNVSATDLDGDIPVLSTSTLPANASFVDNLNGTGSFSFDPDFTQAGIVNITFYATDGVVPSSVDSEIVSITVTSAGNQAPVLATISPQGPVVEGANLSFNVSSSDLDGDIPVLTTSALPSNALFTDNLDGTGSFSFDPDFTQSGNYNIWFYATDGVVPSSVDSELVAITVTDAGNQAPVLATISPQGPVAEGANLSFNISASDLDGDTPVLTTSALPANASFVDNLNGTGSFTFDPDFTQSGVYNIWFYATDGVVPSSVDSELVALTVTDAGNQAPVLATISPQGPVAEGSNLSFNISASDLDGDTPVLTTSALPANASFVDNLNGTGSFSFDPDFTQSGVYNIWFYATDGVVPSSIDSELVAITVTDAGNQAPVLATISPQGPVVEGGVLNFNVSATDLDGDIPVLTTSTLPANASFTDNLDGSGSFSFSPDFTQAGVVNITFYATDGVVPSSVDSEIVSITVTSAGNQEPVLATISPQGPVVEGANLSFNISASDLDGDIPVLTTSALPANASFVDNLNGTGSFSFDPDFTQSGNYDIWFYATDGVVPSSVDSELVSITVTEAGNQEPVLATISPQGPVAEGANLSFVVTASDLDGDIPVLTTSALPTNASFTDNLDGTGSFSFDPDFTQSGNYDIWFYATDGVVPSSVDSELVSITVTDGGNQAPVLATISPQGPVVEGANLSFNVSATDLDGDIPVLTTSALPANASFVDNLDGTGSFSFDPDFTQAGVHDVWFYATDGVVPSSVDSELVSITVTDAGNQEPVLATISPQGPVTEGTNLSFTVTASDLDGDIPTLSTSALPANASFVDNLDGTGSFSFDPDFTQSGNYDIWFYATDGVVPSAVDSELVSITVDDAGNQEPVLATISPQGPVPEGAVLNFTVNASDLDGDIPVLTTSALPANASFTDNLDGTGSFSFSPDFTQSGNYDIWFYATDGAVPSAVDSELVSIAVTELNQLPVLATISPQGPIDEGLTLLFDVNASDGDGTIPVLTTSALPANASFTDNLDGTGSFSFSPNFTQAGVYNIWFYATDAIVPADVDSELVSITVNDANQLPVLATIGSVGPVAEGSTLAFNISATDADGSTPVLTATGLPANASFVDNLNGTGSFSFSPDILQSGMYSITFHATDAVYPADADSEVVTIFVIDLGNNAPPVVAPLADSSIQENQVLVMNVSAADPEGGSVELSVSTSLTHYTFVDNGNGTGVFTYTPTYADQGVDSVTFIATDFGSPRLSGYQVILITTNEVNQAPEFVPAGPVAVKVGKTLNVTLRAKDPTAPDTTARLFLSGLALPANSYFVDHGDNTGTFTYTPVAGQVGADTITFLATDQGAPSLAGEINLVVIVRPVNQLPNLATIGTRQIIEGGTLVINFSATDADGPLPISFSATDMPNNSSLQDNGNGTGSFTFSPNFAQAGLYGVTFKAFDGLDIDKEVVFIQVLEAGNQVPVIDSAEAQIVTEGGTITGRVVAHDIDLGTLSYAIVPGTAPNGFMMFDSGNGVATYQFTPLYNQAGVYNIGVIVSDGEDADTAILVITVNDGGNQEPVLDPIADVNNVELHLITFAVTATDPDSTFPILTAAPLPVGALLSDSGNGHGVFTWTPTINQSGVYPIWFKATDQDFPLIADSQLVVITVIDTNRAPFIFVDPSQKDTLFEGSMLDYVAVGSDPDGGFPVMRAHLSGQDSLATNMIFTDSGNGIGVLHFTPNFTQGNSNPTFYNMVFQAKDAIDSTLVANSFTIAIRVYNKNQKPVQNFTLGTGPFSTVEGDSVVFSVTATDPDGGTPTTSAQNLPPNSSYTGTQNSKQFRFLPTSGMAGSYAVRFLASDAQGAVDTVNVTINVTAPGGNPPTFTTVLADTIPAIAGLTTQTPIAATDIDGDSSITLTVVPVLANSTFVDNGDGTGLHSYSPTLADIGSIILVRFIATDPTLAADTISTYFEVVSTLRGDADSDHKYTLNDIVRVLHYLFRDGPPPPSIESGDADNSGSINLGDVSYMVNFIYNAGPRPPQ